MSTSAALKREFKKFSKAMEAKEYYEASQMCQSLFERQYKVNHSDAIQILFIGCSFLLGDNEDHGVMVLVKSIMRHLTSDPTPENNQLKDILLFIHEKIKCDEEHLESFMEIVTRQLRLDRKHEEFLSDLYLLTGSKLYRDRNYNAAEIYFIRAGLTGAEVIANILSYSYINSEKTRKSTCGYLTRTFLCFMCIGSVKCASRLLKTFLLAINPNVNPDICTYYSQNLLNFLQIFMKAILGNEKKLYEYVCKVYDKSLKAAKCELDEIAMIVGKIYFRPAFVNPLEALYSAQYS